MNQRMRLCRVVTVPTTFITLLRKQIKQIVEAGIDLTLVSSPGPELDEVSRSESVRCCPVPMDRKPSPGHDLRSLNALTHVLCREQFDIVHSSTPKAGLLSALAGAKAQVPVRIHTYTGQAWIELQGPVRWAARFSDRLIGRLTTCCYADSESQRRYLVAERLVGGEKISVLGAGSISGVDLRRFNPSIVTRARPLIRGLLGISESSLVIVFVGRVTRDKGIVELLRAFRTVRESRKDTDLVLVGPLEHDRDPLPSWALEEISGDKRIHSVGFLLNPEEYLASGDIFCLPSYREGFGSVAIEAGALNLPVVATRVTGLIDAVINGETGILVPPKDEAALAKALLALGESPDLRRRMGAAARQRAERFFDASVVNQAMIDEYFRLAGMRR